MLSAAPLPSSLPFPFPLLSRETGMPSPGAVRAQHAAVRESEGLRGGAQGAEGMRLPEGNTRLRCCPRHAALPGHPKPCLAAARSVRGGPANPGRPRTRGDTPPPPQFPLASGNCIGSRNMRNFIMFCLYTSLACLDSLVAGMAYISAALSMSFASPLAFLTLLPHSISQFFSGALLSSEMFVILMLYLWLGIGLACAGFCCHQMLLILRGQTRYQLFSSCSNSP
uniref:Palmitoyltransferase n=1 Tax=Anser brachyrhynchus TaxID=132585 RepID=A0A8B9BCS2_9AVES